MIDKLILFLFKMSGKYLSFSSVPVIHAIFLKFFYVIKWDDCKMRFLWFSLEQTHFFLVFLNLSMEKKNALEAFFSCLSYVSFLVGLLLSRKLSEATWMLVLSYCLQRSTAAASAKCNLRLFLCGISLSFVMSRQEQ